MTKDEALTLALEALEDPAILNGVNNAKFLIKQALAQPSDSVEHEPSARLMTYIGRDGAYPKHGYTVARTYAECPKLHYPDSWEEGALLYTTSPKRTWVELTDEAITEVEDEFIVDYRIPAGSAWNFARAIEAKLKEKNT